MAATRARTRVAVKIPWNPHPIVNWISRHQIDIPAFVVAVAVSGIFSGNKTVSDISSSFLLLSHNVSVNGTQYYTVGPNDVCFTLFFAIIGWTLLRASAMEFVFRPLANRLCRNEHSKTRLCEQGWLGLYYIFSFAAGLKIALESPYANDLRHMWIGYPHVRLTFEMKAYYLLQLSFWMQQLVVIKLERPRKDFLQFVIHHFATCFLVGGSYFYNYTRIGNVILITMDCADIFLCWAKFFNYARIQKASDSIFGLFVPIWIYTRHYFFGRLYLSCLHNTMNLVPARWDPERGYYYSHLFYWFEIGMLSLLHLLQIFWLYLILRVLFKIIHTKKIEDSRSDTENEEVDE